MTGTREGTTLLELMLVLAIMGTATAIVAYAGRSPDRRDDTDQYRRRLRRVAVSADLDTSEMIVEHGVTILVTARRTGEVREDTVRSALLIQGVTIAP